MDIFQVVDQTWPAARMWISGPWQLRDGQGGGKRVSAASAAGDWAPDDIATAEQEMQAMGQPRLFMIRPQDGALDNILASKDYSIIDPVNIYTRSAADIATERPPMVSMFSVWPRLAIQEDIWNHAHIGPARWAVMDRAHGPKTTILARWDDQPAGTAYIACAGHHAMLHALEIMPHQRGKGIGTILMRHAAFWTLDQGADLLSVVCVKTNVAANRLYASLGMQLVGHYHYRIHKDDI